MAVCFLPTLSLCSMGQVLGCGQADQPGKGAADTAGSLANSKDVHELHWLCLTFPTDEAEAAGKHHMHHCEGTELVVVSLGDGLQIDC